MKTKKINYLEYLLYVVSIIAYSLLMFTLFYRQCIEYGGNYISDMLPYLDEIQGIQTDYEFPYPVMFMLARFVSLFSTPEFALALVVTLLNSLSLGLIVYYFKNFLKVFLSESGKRWSFPWVLITLVLAVSLFFVSMLYAPSGHGFFGFDYIYRCVGVYTPNPYWNATFYATRPFSIVCFFSGVRMLDTYETGASFKDYIIFGGSLLLTTLTKPSYTLVAVAVYGVILVFRFIKSRFQNFKATVLFGLTFIPAGLVCLYQFFGVFSGTNVKGEDTGIAFGWLTAWSYWRGNIPLCIFMAAAFPFGVLIINLPRLKDTTWFRHAWQIYLSGLIMLVCLYEKGFRMEHMNFSWGYMHGLFFIFAVSILMLAKNTIERKSRVRMVLVAAGWLGLLWHLICGIGFFIYMFEGGCSGWF